MAAAKKVFRTVFVLFVTLDSAGNILAQSGAEIDPVGVDTKGTGNRAFRFTYGGFEGSDPGFSVARNYAFTRKGEMQKGFTAKLGMLPLGQALKVAQISAKILTQISAQQATG